MEQWKILEKKVVPERGDVRLVFVCEREGRRREAVVSGVTYDAKQVGEMVGLVPEVRR
jgi:hypothetical protein